VFTHVGGLLHVDTVAHNKSGTAYRGKSRRPETYAVVCLAVCQQRVVCVRAGVLWCMSLFSDLTPELWNAATNMLAAPQAAAALQPAALTQIYQVRTAAFTLCIVDMRVSCCLPPWTTCSSGSLCFQCCQHRQVSGTLLTAAAAAAVPAAAVRGVLCRRTC
jgi:hypothetical protein